MPGIATFDMKLHSVAGVNGFKAAWRVMRQQ
jgi:hypothetical protein